MTMHRTCEAVAAAATLARPALAAARALTGTDRTFVMAAARGGMAEVEMGRLAAERGASDAVKQDEQVRQIQAQLKGRAAR